MKRTLIFIVCMLLILSITVPAYAASNSKAYIMAVTADGARVRKEPTSANDNVITSLKKGTKVFYLSKKGAWYKVLSEFGAEGYVYKGFVDYYGAVAKSSIRVMMEDTTMYKKTSVKSKKVKTFANQRFVIVFSKSGKWSYVHTLSGKRGYVKNKYLLDYTKALEVSAN